MPPAPPGTPTKAAPAQAPPIDFAALEEAAGGDRDLVKELASLYREDAARQFAALDLAAAAGDLVRVGRIAHGLKGSSSSVGAGPAAAAFRALEEMGRNGAAEGLAAALARAREECERARAALGTLS